MTLTIIYLKQPNYIVSKQRPFLRQLQFLIQKEDMNSTCNAKQPLFIIFCGYSEAAEQ